MNVKQLFARLANCWVEDVRERGRFVREHRVQCALFILVTVLDLLTLLFVVGVVVALQLRGYQHVSADDALVTVISGTVLVAFHLFGLACDLASGRMPLDCRRFWERLR